MTKGYTDAMKPKKFTGVNFKRWQTRAQLWLTTMGVFWFMGNPLALPLGSEKEVQEFTMATTIFVGCVLSILSDQLCDVYMNIKVLLNCGRHLNISSVLQTLGTSCM